MTKAQKEEIKMKHMKQRDAYDASHLGNYKRVFPS
jgi:hypothetical protein